MFKNYLQKLIDSTIIIGLVTALIYFVSVAYYDGFYAYYGIVDFNVNIGISEIATVTKTIITFIFLYFAICLSILEIIHSVAKVNKYLIHLIVATVFLCVFSIITFKYVGWSAFLMPLPLLFNWIFDFIIPILHFKKEKDICKRLELYANEKKNTNVENRKKNIEYGKIIRTSLRIYLIILIIYGVLSVGHYVGYEIGKNEALIYTNYLVFNEPNQNQDYVLVYRSDEICIFMPMANDDSLISEYRFIPLEDLKDINLKPLNRKLSIVKKK